jgi:hypothetical protein
MLTIDIRPFEAFHALHVKGSYHMHFDRAIEGVDNTY